MVTRLLHTHTTGVNAQHRRDKGKGAGNVENEIVILYWKVSSSSLWPFIQGRRHWGQTHLTCMPVKLLSTTVMMLDSEKHVQSVSMLRKNRMLFPDTDTSHPQIT